ncbi:hypothetical protein ACP4OV_011856 [Aristida adscensionis]
MEPDGGDAGEVAAARAAPEADADADDGADRISALPDDALVLILLRLETDAAARTSVLSRRWRRLWRRLPELSFRRPVAVDRLRAVLEGHEAPLRALLMWPRFATANSAAALLRAAAPLVAGRLNFGNIAPRRDDSEDPWIGAFALPCFYRATSISLDLGFLGLAAPSAGVFARLAELNLRRVRFHGPWGIGDSFSSQRFPCLQKLSIYDARGMESLTLHSDCLRRVELLCFSGLREVTIVARTLEQLRIMQCSSPRQPVANISAPRLNLFEMDMLDPTLVDLGNMEHEHAQWLGTFYYFVYGHNRACQRLLRRFKAVKDLTLWLFYPDSIKQPLDCLTNAICGDIACMIVVSGNSHAKFLRCLVLPKSLQACNNARVIGVNHQYLMDEMTILPDITFLHLTVMANGHVFGASSFHVLRICSGIRQLSLELVNTKDEDYTCPSGCICRLQSNWEKEELLLSHLQEVEITEFRGSEHEVPFMERLLNWAAVLKKLSVIFDVSVTESMAKELYQIVQSFSRPEICMEFYRDLNGNKVLYAPKD